MRKKSAIYFVASPVRSIGSPFGGAGTTAVVTERVSQFGIRLNVCSRIRHLFLISYVRWSGLYQHGIFRCDFNLTASVHFLAGSFRDQIAANIAAGGAVSLDGIAQRYAGFLPEAFRASIVDACERSISAVLNDNAVVLADTIVQKVLAPLLTPVISLVLFFVAFALLRMLVSLLVTVLGLVNKLPVIGAVNHWLGWGVGGIASLVDIYLVLCVVWALIVITSGNLTMLNDTVMSGSLYYKVFNVFNPFV